MKTVLATGIFYPEVGGPAMLVKNLFDELKKRATGALVLTYSSSSHSEADSSIIKIYRSFKILNYLKYFRAVLKNINREDKVIVFDIFSAALPVAAATLFKPFRFTVRLGGDFLWETAVTKFNKEVTLTDYYQTKFNLIERLYFYLIKFIFNRAERIITTTAYQQKLVEEYYGQAPKKFIYIPNGFPEVKINMASAPKKQLIFVGRFTKLKNLARLILAFKELTNTNYQLLLVGAGPEENNLKLKIEELKLEGRIKILAPAFGEQLQQLILESRWLILPSLSDISPNVVLEAIVLNTPVLMTKHSGYFEDFKDWLFFINNPLNSEEITIKLDYLLSLSENQYLSVKYALTKINQSHNVVKMAADYLALAL